MTKAYFLQVHTENLALISAKNHLLFLAATIITNNNASYVYKDDPTGVFSASYLLGLLGC